MQAADTESKVAQSKIVSRNQHWVATYSKVRDKRKRPIRAYGNATDVMMPAYRRGSGLHLESIYPEGA